MEEKDILTINIIKLKQHIQFPNKTKEYNFKQQIKRANKDNLIKQLYNLCIKLIDNKPLETYNSPENLQIKDELINSERKNHKLEKEIEELKKELEEYKNTRKYSKRNRELLDKAEEELRTKDNIIICLNNDIDKLRKPNINITIEEEDNNNNIDENKSKIKDIINSPSMFDFDNDSEISDNDYDPYSEDNIDPTTAPEISDFTASEIDMAREVCGYDAWNQLTEQGQLQFLLENEN